MKFFKIKKETLLLIWLSFTIGIFDGLFGIDIVRKNIFPIEYQSFWGSLFSIYFLIGIFLIYGKSLLKDKLKLVQVVLLSLLVYNLAVFVHRLDAVRLNFISLDYLMKTKYEFNGLLGNPLFLTLQDIIFTNLLFLVIVITIQVYKTKMRNR